MGLFNFWKKENSVERDYSEAATKAKVTRLSNDIQNITLKAKERQLRRLKQKLEEREMEAEIAELEAELYGEEEESEESPMALMQSPEALLMSIISQAALKRQSPAAETTSNAFNSNPLSTSSAAGVKITDEEIRQFKSKLPKAALKYLKKSTDEELEAQIKSRLPNIDDDTIDRAIIILRE